MNVGDEAPLVQFEATHGLTTTFEHFQGGWLVLYFYPKNATPGCTLESCDFRDNEKDFSLLNATVLGISRDSLASHEKFKTKQSLPFDLISDRDEVLCQAFDVIKMKSMYGKQVRGIERSTFLIDPKGVIRFAWRKVRVKGHVEDVLKQLNALHVTS